MPAAETPFSIYVHIPYCVRKCPYCDFNSHVVARVPETEYTAALIEELDTSARQDGWRGRPVQSIFFGGGTPSLFHPESIEAVLAAVARRFNLAQDCEITLEANPGSVDAGNFAGYRACGVNRISLGVQSFQPRLLRFLGRAHSAEEARQALRIVRACGFDRFSFDLIYAMPGQTLAELESDIQTSLEFGPPHLSAYNLTFEEGTPFHREFQAGRLNALGEDEEIAMAKLIEARLAAAGLRRYEISNYAVRGHESRHNTNYWRAGDYLGLGAGAHSYRKGPDGVTGERWSNKKNPARYMASVANGSAVSERESIDTEKAAAEFMFLGLRMTEGIPVEAFRQRFGVPPVEYYPEIRLWLETALLEEKNGFLRLTPDGLMVANSIFVCFI